MSGTAGAILLQMAPVGLELFELPAKLDLKVTNPYPVNVRISNVKYEVFIEGRPVATGEQTAEALVPKESFVILSVPLSVSAADVLGGIKTTLARRGVKYQVRGTYTVASEVESEFRVSSLLKPLLKRK
jgi:LEA14-like dessication related protein